MRRIVSIALSVGVAALVWLARRPPAPAGTGAPLKEFSAARARAALARVLGNGSPHPLGSTADAAVRERLVAELSALALPVRIETRFSTGIYRTAGTVRNVLARIPGRESRPAVLVSVHYDSVPAGPGASDDGMGVAAALELARALRAGPPLAHDVILLFDEGEEAGLLGAEAFASDPWAGDVGAVVNLEARGTEGPVFLFETTRPDAWMMRTVAPALRHPNASSLSVAVYRAMPNDTDLTVFARKGLPGINFACIGGVTRYHTPRDDLAHQSAATLQEMGGDALAAVRALAGGPLRRGRPSGDATFIDLCSRRILWWRSSWDFPLALLALAAALAAALRRERLAGSARSLAGALFAVLLGGAAGWLVERAAASTGASVPRAWIAHPGWLWACALALALAAAAASCAALLRRADAREAAAGVGFLLALAAAAVARVLPGASAPFLLPALAAALAAWLPAGGEAIFAAAAAFFWWPLVPLIGQSLGTGALPVIGALAAAGALGLFPACAGAPRRPAAIAALLAAVAAGAFLLCALAAPRFTRDRPAHANLVWTKIAGEDTAQWSLAGPRAVLAGFLPSGFAPEAGARFPWERASEPGASPSSRWSAPGPDPGWAAPELTPIAAPSGRLAFRLRSGRGASIAAVAFPPSAEVTDVRFDGEAFPPPSPRLRGISGAWSVYRDMTLPAEGVEVSFARAGTGPLTLYAFDESGTLPERAGTILSKLPPSAVPVQMGDGSVVAVRFQLP